MRTRIRGGDDRGAFAVIYALLVVLLVGVVALVIDIGQMRSDRRTDRAATDAAAIAGASRIGQSLKPDPLRACQSAWAYALQGLGATSATNPCSPTFVSPGGAGYTTCPAAASTASGSVTVPDGTATISITWPVLDNDTLMLPDVRPLGAGVSQTVVPADGTACKRLGVAISRSRQLRFASVWGAKSPSTAVHSVALYTFDSGPSGVAAPLVILDPSLCEALVADGGGKVLIAPNDSVSPGVPGLIAVNSDGSGSNCGGGKTVIDSVSQAVGTNSAIWAQDSATGGTARILSYALLTNPSRSYIPAQVTCTSSASVAAMTGSPVCPEPSPLSGQVSRFAFIDNLYNCVVAGTCAAANDPKNGVGQLRTFVANNFSSAGNGTYPAGFTHVTGNQCSPTAAQTTYTGNVFVDCTGNGKNSFFSVSNTVSFVGGPGTTIVFAGDVKVATGGCLTFNVAAANAATSCVTPTFVDQPQDGPVVYVGGQLQVQSSNSSIIAPQTFMMVGNCSTDGTTCALTTGVGISTGGTGNVLWSAPLGPLLATPTSCLPGTATTAPSAACFAKLALWDEHAAATNQQSLFDSVGGQATLDLQGTFFTPNLQFNLHGGSTTNIRSAQFITGRLDVNGGSLLTMVPDADHTNNVPLLVASLIR